VGLERRFAVLTSDYSFCKMHVDTSLIFAITYLCEQGFSALTVVKTKARNHLDPGDDLRIALSKTEPCIEDIMKEKFQFHQSH